MAKDRQMSESYLTGALLALVGGYLDAYTYIARGHVFANAQTGNIVLLGMRMAAGEWLQALHYLVPIGAFALGIVIAEMTKNKYKERESIHWRQLIIAIEACLLVFVGFIPPGETDMLANICISFVCALQTQTFRKINGNVFATTMCTGNLRSATEHLFSYRLTKSRKSLYSSLQYYGIILFFILGALTGSVLTEVFATRSVLFACTGLLLVFAVMFKKEPQTG